MKTPSQVMKSYLGRMTKDELIQLALHTASLSFIGYESLARHAHTVRYEAASRRHAEAWDRHQAYCHPWRALEADLMRRFAETKDTEIRYQLAKEIQAGAAEEKQLWEAYIRAEDEATKIWEQGPPKTNEAK